MVCAELPYLLAGLQVIDKMVSDPVLGKHLRRPSVSVGSRNLYAPGIFEVRPKQHRYWWYCCRVQRGMNRAVSCGMVCSCVAVRIESRL